MVSFGTSTTRMSSVTGPIATMSFPSFAALVSAILEREIGARLVLEMKRFLRMIYTRRSAIINKKDFGESIASSPTWLNLEFVRRARKR